MAMERTEYPGMLVRLPNIQARRNALGRYAKHAET
jgi:hypothetical protein